MSQHGNTLIEMRLKAVESSLREKAECTTLKDIKVRLDALQNSAYFTQRTNQGTLDNLEYRVQVLETRLFGVISMVVWAWIIFIVWVVVWLIFW